MLERIIEYLRKQGEGEAQSEFADAEVAEAIAALFKQMALADGTLKQEEISTAIRTLVKEYGYLDEADGGLEEQFRSARHETVFPLAVIINRSLPAEKRHELKKQLLAVAMSDREFHPDEQALMELLDELIDD